MSLCSRKAPILALVFAVAVVGAASADVKTDERTQLKFEGMLGRMVGLFGGKAMQDGIVNTVAVKGDRKMTVSPETGEMVDLAEEKIYRLDMRKKTYTVVTFDELRRQMREAQEKAREQAKKMESEQPEPQKADEPQVEVDFDLKETGQRKTIAGHECREVVATVTVREKGKTLEQGGGMVLVSNTWLAPEIPALKEDADFDRRYAQKLYGELVSVEAMQQMGAAMAMYPGMQQAMERLSKENVNMSGTPLLTTMAFQLVKSEQQMAQEKSQGAESSGTPTSVGGLGGLFAKKMMKKKESPESGGQAANRATIMTSTTEVLKISTDVGPADVSVPAGFKQKP